MWFSVVLAVGIPLVAALVCPGGGKTCQTGMTCCELPSGKQGCCPFENATCCPDKVHCCPNGSDCLSGFCHRHYDDITNMVNYQEPPEKLASESYPAPNSSLEVRCLDGSICSDISTCCELSPSKYGCCPFPDGVCCQDHLTCCPKMYTCVPGRWCKPQVVGNNLNPVKRAPVNTVCPGGKQICPSGNTCCPARFGRWSCCPLLAATCCADQLHCCPHDYHCTDTGYCVKANGIN